MRLKAITLRRNWKDDTVFAGTAEFEGETGSVELNLTADQARQIVILCADSLIEIAELRAADMKAEIIDGQLALPPIPPCPENEADHD